MSYQFSNGSYQTRSIRVTSLNRDKLLKLILFTLACTNTLYYPISLKEIKNVYVYDHKILDNSDYKSNWA